MTTMQRWMQGLVVCAALGAVACGGDDGGGAGGGAGSGGSSGNGGSSGSSGSSGSGGSAGEVALANIEVTLEREGTAEGAVYVGAFTQNPPRTKGPVAFFRLKSTDVFPYQGTLRNIEPGTYYAIGVFDVGGDDPNIPGAEDVQIASDPIELNGVDQSVTIKLVTP
jgi:hypothetical protein